MRKDGVSCKGHIGLRASLVEGSRIACGRTYLKSFYEIRPRAPTPSWSRP